MKIKLLVSKHVNVEVSKCGKHCGENPKCCDLVYHGEHAYCDLFLTNTNAMRRLYGKMHNIFRCQACIDAEKRTTALEGK